MLELLQNVLNFASGLLSAALGLVILLLNFSVETLTLLHNGMPRLEGLLVGVLLAWLMARRDKHPLLRALSAPLKLALDILDMAWEKCIKAAADLCGTAASWSRAASSWACEKVLTAYGLGMGWLKAALSKLKRS